LVKTEERATITTTELAVENLRFHQNNEFPSEQTSSSQLTSDQHKSFDLGVQLLLRLKLMLISVRSLRSDFQPCVSVSDEAGPGPVKSKYDALDFDTLLKEAQKSLHR